MNNNDNQHYDNYRQSLSERSSVATSSDCVRTFSPLSGDDDDVLIHHLRSAHCCEGVLPIKRASTPPILCPKPTFSTYGNTAEEEEILELERQYNGYTWGLYCRIMDSRLRNQQQSDRQREIHSDSTVITRRVVLSEDDLVASTSEWGRPVDDERPDMPFTLDM